MPGMLDDEPLPARFSFDCIYEDDGIGTAGNGSGQDEVDETFVRATRFAEVLCAETF